MTSGVPDGPTTEGITTLGWLSFLAAFCPVHRRAPGYALSNLFIPAVNNDCVRLFKNDDGYVCAALIWARLSDSVSERMVFDRRPPDPSEWISGSNLWFLDVLAPFNHGTMIARHIARHPPEEPFYFARLNAGGDVRKVVRADANRKRGRVHAFFVDTDGVGT
ncbi:MAG: toxin-activating lysine-acyltransferase [Arenibacterium sp.]